jgi:protein-S-isoprenylcysteine O-methyltransferase Ste14
MPPAASKAPLDYLFALVVCAVTIGVSFDVEPSETHWIVFAVGVVMAIAVVLAAARPSRSS